MNTTPWHDSNPVAILAAAQEEVPMILITVCENRVEHIWVASDSVAGGLALVVPLEKIPEPPTGMNFSNSSKHEAAEGCQTVKIHRLRDETQEALLSLLQIRK